MSILIFRLSTKRVKWFFGVECAACRGSIPRALIFLQAMQTLFLAFFFVTFPGE